MNNKRCAPCNTPIELKPYNRYSERVLEKQKEKKSFFQIKLTTYLRGESKNEFMDDCMRRSEVESELFRQIIKLHYDIINTFPELKGKDFSEIKSFLLK